MANKKIENGIKYRFQGSGLEGDERRWAKKQFENYRKNYSIDNFSDIQLLESLVFREVIQERYKKKIAELNKNKKVTEENLIPSHILEDLNENLKTILELKTRLGLFEVTKENDPFKYFKRLAKKFKIWRSEISQASKTIPCPWCSKMIFLVIKTDAYDALKHPFFEDKILYNKHLMKMLQEDRIEKIDVAKVLLGANCKSEDYVDWLLKKKIGKEVK